MGRMTLDIQKHLDPQRLWRRIMDLSRHGGFGEGGVNRPALSASESEARATIFGWGRAIGLQPFTDAIGNLFLRLEGSEPDLPAVLGGSHIDSQPTGGRFDGVYGVLATMEVMEAILASGGRLRRSIEVVAWTNEEGSRFAPGMSGSTAFCKPRMLPEILTHKDARGVTIAEAVSDVLAGDDAVPQRPLGRIPYCFVEPHIEQGPDLERAGVPIGVVLGIQGTRRYRIRVTGKAAHSGTEPMEQRRDAMLAAARMVSRLEPEAAKWPGLKFTVGLFEIKPNAPSVVPAEAYFAIDIRHPDNGVVDAFDAVIRAVIPAEKGACEVELRQIVHAPSLTFDAGLRALIARSAERLGLKHREAYSAAGHDARLLHYECPTAMIFIPCKDGLSHNPAEWVEPVHAEAGLRVHAEVLLDRANA
jgi:N-carbamoyl-L-amino-acid hydrolase